jgi:photosystem II stability/assembly factor-like uncharacterized protein
MTVISSTLLEAAKSDPRNIRLIFSWFENGVCFVEVQECYNILDMTFEINGETTEVLCTNIHTGENEVVAVIESGATKKVTFDISRLLPLDHVSRFMDLVRRNCGLRVFIARASECIDPWNVNDFNVLDILGEVSFGNYTRTSPLNRDKAQAVAIEESTTVTAFEWLQAAPQNIATRGGLNTVPIVDMTICDEEVCGGECEDDSDGCQKYYWVDNLGVVGWTSNQWFSENILPAISLQADPDLTLIWSGPAKTISCAPRGGLLVTDSSGTVFSTSRDDMLDNDPATVPIWQALQVDIDGVDLPVFNRAHEDESAGVVWYVGDAGAFYQYNAALGTMTPVPTIPGLSINLLDIDINGDNIVIVGEDATLLWSKDGGNSFTLVTVIDPLTQIALDVAVDLTAVEMLSDVNIAVGTSDDRILYTQDSARTWFSQLIYGAGAGAITDLEFDDKVHLVGLLTRNVAGVGSVWKTYYGNCEEWLEVPEDETTLPANGGLDRIVMCPDNINTWAVSGTSDGAAGVIFVGTTPTK